LKERAQRFGLPIKDNSATASPLESALKSGTTQTEQDKRNVRAKRFAPTSVSPRTASIFPHVGKPNLKWTASDEEKKRKRAEKFALQSDKKQKTT